MLKLLDIINIFKLNTSNTRFTCVSYECQYTVDESVKHSL